jgi:hypothetical protein
MALVRDLFGLSDEEGTDAGATSTGAAGLAEVRPIGSRRR